MRAHSDTRSIPPAFAPIVSDLRDGIIEHYEGIGQTLATPAGLRTLDTNSTLAADRGRNLLRLLAVRGGGTVSGRRVLDLGAGFGALSLYFAHLGADVVAVDPHGDRLVVAQEIAQAHDLRLTTVVAAAEQLPFEDASFDVTVANNSLCYIVASESRRAALAEIRRTLRPGGWLLTRNPNRLHPRDQFTGLPGISLLPSRLADRAAGALGRHRSTVRLHSPGAAVRECRRAGFVGVRSDAGASPARHVAGYHHLAARRPPA